MDRDILERTHLRLFALQSPKKKLGKVSCRFLDVIPASVPVRILFPFAGDRRFAPLSAAFLAVMRRWTAAFECLLVSVAASGRRGVVPGPIDEILTAGVLANNGPELIHAPLPLYAARENG